MSGSQQAAFLIAKHISVYQLQNQKKRYTPARLPANAAAKLPRLFLLVVGLVYILAGLFYRDPWKTDDVTSLATMISAIQNHDWLLPHVGNAIHTQSGPLITMVGASFIWLFSPLFELFFSPLNATIIASRLPNLVWFGLMTSSVWYGTYLLGRRPEAQPLALPFGGEPNAKDYGRMLADAALLLIVATVGIIWRMHETSAVPATIALHALAFYAIARVIDHPTSGSITLGMALGLGFLNTNWQGLAPQIIAIAIIFSSNHVLRTRSRYLPISAVISIAIVLFWWIPASHTNHYWLTSWLMVAKNNFSWPNINNIISIIRDLPWFLWPTWPLAILALWRWRKWLGAIHIVIPAALLLGSAISLLFMQDPFEPEYSILVIPSAILAALALPTLKRGIVNILDWFAVMCFSLTAVTVWLGWIALQAGWPSTIAANIARQTHGLYIHVAWPATALAVLGSITWILLVVWRLRNHPVGLWRGTALSAGGLITTWLLLATLWMPPLDYARSYREVSNSLAQALATYQQPGQCIRAIEVGNGQRASFLVFNNIELSTDGSCDLLLQQLDPDSLKKGTAGYGNYTTIWEGRRTPDRHEMFRLLVLAKH